MLPNAEVLVLLFVSDDSFELRQRVERVLAGFSKTYRLSLFDGYAMAELAESYGAISTPAIVIDDLTTGKSSLLVGEPTDAELHQFFRELPEVVIGHAAVLGDAAEASA